MKNEPWTCPVCGAGVAPWVERCVHTGEAHAGTELYGDGKGNFVKQSADYAPSDDGWIEWKGAGPCPLPKNARFAYRTRCGSEFTTVGDAPYMRWEWLSMHAQYDDIIAYRVVRP